MVRGVFFGIVLSIAFLLPMPVQAQGVPGGMSTASGPPVMQTLPWGVGTAAPPIAETEEMSGLARLFRRFSPLSFSASWVATGEIVVAAGLSEASTYEVNVGPGSFERYALSVGSDVRLRFRLRGLWVGLDLPFSITERLYGSLEGGYFIPMSNRASINAGTYGRATLIRNGSRRPDLVGSDEALELEGRPSWWFADLGASYSLPEGLAIIAGLRYDTITASTQVVQLSSFLAGYIGSLPTVDLEVNSVVPYVGLHFRTGGPRRSVGITLKSFPYIFYPSLQGMSDGYFGEFKLEYGGAPEMFPDLFVRVFARGNVIHASFKADAPEVITFGNIVPSVPQPMPETMDRSPADVTAHWQQITLGVAISLSFAMPI